MILGKLIILLLIPEAWCRLGGSEAEDSDITLDSDQNVRGLQTSLSYSGSSCAVLGPTSGDVVMSFFAFGDTPYDKTPGPPSFQGADYNCLSTKIIPGMKLLAGSTDFVMHVGDIKPGNSTYSMYCTDLVFGNRRDLFQTLEPTIDFFIVPGDNEWNECNGYITNVATADVAKTLWRNYFAMGVFAQFSRTLLPSGESAPTVIRPSDQSQNFFFYYPTKKIAFVGITEPAGDTAYDSVNANWLSSNLSGKSLKAIVIIGHASLSSNVRKVLDSYKSIPSLYVKGDSHSYCFRFVDRKKYPNLLELTVASFTMSPYLVTLRKDSKSGEHFFSIQEQASLRNVCVLCIDSDVHD